MIACYNNADKVLKKLDKRKSLTDVIGMKLLSPEISLEEIREASRATLERLENESDSIKWV